MQQSLHSNTAQLPYTPMNGEVLDVGFATHTQAAMATGALAATIGAAGVMLKKITQAYACAPQIVISGGHASTIAPYLQTYMTNQATIVDNLVLHGLYLLADT